MKQIIAVVLTLAICIGLCACGNAEKEDGAVVATAKQEKDTVVYHFDGSNTGDVTVEEVVVRPHTVGHDGSLFFDWEMKVRNTGSEDTVPDETVLRVWFRYLDENGDAIAETQGEAGKYSPVKSGQAEWIQISGRLGDMDSSEVEATAFIEIFAYTKKVRTKPEVFYEEPILIDIRELVKDQAEGKKPVETAAQEADTVAYRFDGTNTGDVTVEEVAVRPHTVGHDGSLFFDWEMKVRNTGSEDTVPDETVLRVWFRYLDKNGDVIAETQGEAGKYSPVKSGQAEWIQISGRLGDMDSSEVEATAFIEIFAYTKKVRTKPEVYYDEPILIDIRNFVK